MRSKSRHLAELRANNQKTTERLLQEVAVGQAEFVLTELDAAIIFSEVALSTQDPEKKTRNIKNALEGYATALRFSRTPGNFVRGDERFHQKEAKLKEMLQQLGQIVTDPVL